MSLAEAQGDARAALEKVLGHRASLKPLQRAVQAVVDDL
jgi:hypothetical protein